MRYTRKSTNMFSVITTTAYLFSAYYILSHCVQYSIAITNNLRSLSDLFFTIASLFDKVKFSSHEAVYFQRRVSFVMKWIWWKYVRVIYCIYSITQTKYLFLKRHGFKFSDSYSNEVAQAK